MAINFTMRVRTDYPIPSSSAASSGVPHRRQITAPQSPQVSGSAASTAHLGQYNSGFGASSSAMTIEIYNTKVIKENGQERRDHSLQRLNSNAPLVPPKPNEFDIANSNPETFRA